MNDKYSKIEEKVEEGRRRVGWIEKVLAEFLEFVDWEIVDVKNDVQDVRINFVKIVPKNSAVRFAINRKKTELEERFWCGEKNSVSGSVGFLDNRGMKEKLSLRIG